MTKFKKFAILALVPLFAFFSCKNDNDDGNYVNPDESPRAELSIVGNSLTGSTDSYILDLTNSLPGELKGEFTVYIKNSKPSNVLIQSTSKKVSFTKGSIEDTTAADSVGSGAYKVKVSYSVAQDLGLAEGESVLSFDFNVFAQFSTQDAISKKVNFNVSYVSADSNLALSNFAVSGQNEHVFTLSWENPSGVEFQSMNYVIYLLTTTGEGESAETTKTSVETGSLEPDATSFTTKSNLQAKSKYSVEITAVTANAWYTSSTDGVEISTTDDITPPNKPNVTLVSNTEDSITLKYIKGDSSDDTATLWFSVSGEGSDKATISASLNSESEPITYSETSGLDVSSIETNAVLTILISGLPRSQNTSYYTITVHAKDALGNDSANNADENNRNAVISASTTSDTSAPELSSSSVKLDNGFSSAKISWTAPGDSDFAGVKIKKGDDELADVKVGTNQYVLTGLTENASYSLFAYDGAGNVQETGVNAEVELSTFTASAAPKYTGSILVTWNDITDYASNGDKITYTYTVS